MIVWALVGMVLGADADSNLDSALATLRKVGREAKGNAEAVAAWRVVADAEGADLSKILSAFKGANPLAVNYLTSAVDAVVEKHPKDIPVKELLVFVKDSSHDPKARRLAFEWITKDDPARKKTLLAGMLDDPSLDLRRDAVQLVLDRATKELDAKDTKAAKKSFLLALSAARDQDQLTKAVTSLRGMGEPLDVSRHMGFLIDWKLIGPFENKDGVGWNKAYPPETELKFDAEYPGKIGKVKWFSASTDDDLGNMDLNKIYDTRHKGAVTYCYTEFKSDKEQDVEIRLGSITAWKLWVNGKLIFERNESHAGYGLDQYVVPVHFSAGKNTIVLKLCQNEMTQPWAQEWNFRMRVTDSLGSAILAADRAPANPTLGKKEKSDDSK